MDFFALTGLINAIAVSGLALFSFARNTRQSYYRLFSLALVFTAIWSYCYFFWQISDNATSALFWSRALMAGAIFIPFAYFHFVVVFIGEYKRYRTLVLVWYGIGLASLVADFTPYFVQDVQPRLQFAFWPTPGPLFHPFLLLWLSCVVWTIILLWNKYRSTRSIFQAQLKYLLIGCTISYLSGATNFFLWYNIPVQPLGNGLVLIFPILIGFASLRYRLFDLRIQLQKIVNIVLPIMLSMLLTLLVAWSLITFTHLSLLVISSMALLQYTLVYEIFARLFRHTALAHILFQRAYHYQQSLTTLAQEAPTVVDITVLASKITTVIHNTMRVEKVAILLDASGQENNFTVLQAMHDTADNLVLYTIPSPQILAAMHSDTPIYIAHELPFRLQENLPFAQQEQLISLQQLMAATTTELLMGLYAQHVLIGFMILGQKLNGEAYTIEDIELLETIAAPLGSALMNAKLYQNLQHTAQIESEFIDITSHQLRTPLSAIHNTLDLVLSDYISPQQTITDTNAIQLLHNAFLASHNLHNTIEQIIAAAELLHSTPHVNNTAILLPDFFQKRLQRAQQLLQLRTTPVTLTTDFDPNLPATLKSDEAKLAMMIDVVLENAINYTTQGSITLTVQAITDQCVITIQDTGIGIPASTQSSIFQRFVRLPNARKLVPDGSGLGLYLAQYYATLLHGTIRLISEEHKGTTVTITIPTSH